MIRLNPEQMGRARSLLLDLLIRTHLVPNSRSETYANPRSGYSLLTPYFDKMASTLSRTIITSLLSRSFKFAEVDEAISSLTSRNFMFGDTPASTDCRWAAKNDKLIARYLAWTCAENKIYWNDLAYTEAERASMREKSIFAAALYEAECFVSQPSAKPKVARSKSAGKTGAAGTGPKSDYKTAGPQSAFVAGLIGKPGEKVSVSSSIIYCIVGDKAGTITPKAFIHPVENPGVGERAKVNEAGLPIVKFGAGNGYTDLAIFSENAEDMERIYAALVKDGKAISKYSGVHVAKTRNDSSGYFKVNTEFGPVLVKPTKLNEKLFTETLEAMCCEEAADTLPLEESGGIEISDFNKFARDSKMYD
jgi:hypothetical protein